MNKKKRSKPACKYCRAVLSPGDMRRKRRLQPKCCPCHESTQRPYGCKHRPGRRANCGRKDVLHRVRKTIVSPRIRYLSSRCRVFNRRGNEFSHLRAVYTKDKNKYRIVFPPRTSCINCCKLQHYKYIPTKLRTASKPACSHKKCPESKIQSCIKLERTKICKSEPTDMYCRKGKSKRDRSISGSKDETDRGRDTQCPILIKSELTENARRIGSTHIKRPNCNDEITCRAGCNKSDHDNKNDIKLLHNCAIGKPIPLSKTKSTPERAGASSTCETSNDCHHSHEGADVHDKKQTCPRKRKGPCIDQLCTICPNKGNRVLVSDKHIPILSRVEYTPIENAAAKRTHKKQRLNSGRSAPKSVVDNVPLPGHIRIRILDTNGYDSLFQMKNSADMHCLKVCYSKVSGVNPNKLRFLFDGHVVEDHMTPFDMELEDEDIIQVFFLQRECTADEGDKLTEQSKGEDNCSQMLSKGDEGGKLPQQYKDEHKCSQMLSKEHKGHKLPEQYKDKKKCSRILSKGDEGGKLPKQYKNEKKCSLMHSKGDEGGKLPEQYKDKDKCSPILSKGDEGDKLPEQYKDKDKFSQILSKGDEGGKLPEQHMDENKCSQMLSEGDEGGKLPEQYKDKDKCSPMLSKGDEGGKLPEQYKDKEKCSLMLSKGDEGGKLPEQYKDKDKCPQMISKGGKGGKFPEQYKDEHKCSQMLSMGDEGSKLPEQYKDKDTCFQVLSKGDTEAIILPEPLKEDLNSECCTSGDPQANTSEEVS